ncbi:MAG TPA: thioesterase family protein [Chroococcales cyanobacterium]
MLPAVNSDNYKHWTPVSLRYCDTDALGHINNVAYCALFESGRAALLFDGIKAISPANTTFVIAALNISFRAEMGYPGTADVGTRVKFFGRSSVQLEQAIFKDGVCSASAESTLVLIDENTRKPIPIPDTTRDEIQRRTQFELVN